MKLYVDELPKTCKACKLRYELETYPKDSIMEKDMYWEDICSLTNQILVTDVRHKDCPLKQLPPGFTMFLVELENNNFWGE